MLEDNSDSWLHQWEAQGMQKGLQSTLLSLIQHKFGAVQDKYQQEAAQGNPQQLAMWSLRVLDASTIDEVFHVVPDEQV